MLLKTDCKSINLEKRKKNRDNILQDIRDYFKNWFKNIRLAPTLPSFVFLLFVSRKQTIFLLLVWEITQKMCVSVLYSISIIKSAALFKVKRLYEFYGNFFVLLQNRKQIWNSGKIFDQPKNGAYGNHYISMVREHHILMISFYSSVYYSHYHYSHLSTLINFPFQISVSRPPDHVLRFRFPVFYFLSQVINHQHSSFCQHFYSFYFTLDDIM